MSQYSIHIVFLSVFSTVLIGQSCRSVRVSAGNRRHTQTGKLQKVNKGQFIKLEAGYWDTTGDALASRASKARGVMCQGLLHLRDMDSLTRSWAGDQYPYLTPLPFSSLCQGSLLAEPMPEDEEPVGVVHRVTLLGRDRGREGEEWIWLGKWEISRQCASYIIFMSLGPRTTLTEDLHP